MTAICRNRLVAGCAALLWLLIPDAPGWVWCFYAAGAVAVWQLPGLWADRHDRRSLLLAIVITAGMLWEVWPWVVLGIAWFSARWAGDRPVIRRRCVLLMVLGGIFGLTGRPALVYCLHAPDGWWIWVLLPLAVLLAAGAYLARREHLGFWVLSPVGRLGAMGSLYFAGLGMCQSFANGTPAAPWFAALLTAAGLAVTAQLVHGVVYCDPALRRSAAAGQLLAAVLLGFSLLTAGYFLPYKRGFVTANESNGYLAMRELEPVLDRMVRDFRTAHGRWPEAREWSETERRPWGASRITGTRLDQGRLMLYCRVPLGSVPAILVRCYEPDGRVCWYALGRNNPLWRMLPLMPMGGAESGEKPEK